MNKMSDGWNKSCAFDRGDHEEGFVMLEPTSQKEGVDDGEERCAKPRFPTSKRIM